MNKAMTTEKTDKKTHFGYEEVPWGEKVQRVHQVFESVANRYDLMNDVMSLGIHRCWKSYCVQISGVRTGQSVLDLAGGSGDLTLKFAPLVGEKGHVVLADINAAMLEVGRDRLIDAGHVSNVHFAQVNAECLPFENNLFDCVCIAFGLRNVTDKEAALRSMYRVLKPGGRLLILEFSKPVWPLLGAIYDAYSFNLLPRIGEMITGDGESYRYLVESIRMHPDQPTLKTMIETAGFEDCHYHNLSGGIVALHKAYKY